MWYSLSKNSLSIIRGRMPIGDYGGSSSFQVIDGKIISKTAACNKCYTQYSGSNLSSNPKPSVNRCTAHSTALQATNTNTVTSSPHRTYRLPKSKLRKKIYSFYNLPQSSKFCAFYSISFPHKTPDNLAFKLMNNWLTRCRKNEGLRHYLWVSERQKNGTIHFHMITNQYMPIKNVNKYMAAAINTQFNKNNFTKYVERPKDYNGVDVDSLYHSKRHYNRTKKLTKEQSKRKLARYLTKYITKNDVEFTRLTWHASRSISALFTSKRFDANFFEKLENMLSNNADKIDYIEGEHYNLYILNFEIDTSLFEDMFLVNAEIFEYFNNS